MPTTNPDRGSQIVNTANYNLLAESEPSFIRFLEFCDDHTDISFAILARIADARIRYNIHLAEHDPH